MSIVLILFPMYRGNLFDFLQFDNAVFLSAFRCKGCFHICCPIQINIPIKCSILQLRGLPPFYSKKYDLKQHPNYKYTAEADKVKNAFDLNSLVTRRMDKLNPNETYTVYKVDVPDEALTGEDEDILNYDDLDDPDAFV